MNRQEAREYVNSHPLTDFCELERSRSGMYCCPVCGSGTGPNKSGALKLYNDTNRVFCYSNGCALGDRGQDTLGALRIIWGCDENEVFERVGVELDGHAIRTDLASTRTASAISERTDYTDFYIKANEQLKSDQEAMDYLTARGISQASIDKFRLGYVRTWSHPKTNGKFVTKRIIIPRSSCTYTARAIDTTEPNYSDAYKKQVVGSQRDTFNIDAARGTDVVIIVEGELDAISVEQVTNVPTVGIGSISNIRTFCETIHDVAPKAVCIVSLDNDKPREDGKNPGQDAQRKLMEGLQAKGMCAIAVDGGELYGECKDANELLVKDAARLMRVMSGYVAQAEEAKFSAERDEQVERAQRTGIGMMQAFMEKVETRAYEPMPTGIPAIDRALSGGFVRKTLNLIAAAPGVGKTMLSQQMFETMAKTGYNVLFLNLEMSRDQLLARSISRICHKQGTSITPLQVLRGYEWTDAQREAVMNAGMTYVDELGDRFVYNPKGTTARLDDILRVMEDEAATLESEGKSAPLVVVDYLQLVQGKDREDEVSAMKRAVKLLKDYAIEHDTIVYVITATNREANKSGQVEQWSGRDTSAIEYSADTLLALTYTAIEDGEEIDVYGSTVKASLDVINRLKKDAYKKGTPAPDVCSRVTLKVLKNRLDDSYRTVDLVFDGAHATFYESVGDRYGF